MTGTVTAEAAAATGLRTGTPVVAGGGDQSANAVGVGAVAPGVLPCRWAHPESSLPRPITPPTSGTAAFTPSATPCPGGGT